MSRKFILTVLGILVVSIIGATAIFLLVQRPTPLPNHGITTELHGIVTNLEAQRNFLKAYSQGNPGQWQKIVYTIEGDPIIYIVRYDNQPSSLKVSIDTRQDKFGLKRLDTFTCHKMAMVDKLRLQGCTGVSSGEIIIP